MPLQSILFDHPQCIDDVVSMSPRAKGRSLLQQQLNSFFSAIAICDDEPRTEDPGAAVDATEAVKQNVHGLLSNDSCNGLLPQLRADAFPSRQAIFSQCPVLVDIALWLLDGVVFELTLNVNRVLLFEIFFPTWWGSLYIHFILTHWHNNCDRHTQFLFDAHQVASCLQAAKQHSRLRCRATNDTRVERPGSNGVELVIVIPRDFIQCRPGLGVIVSLLDILLPSSRPCSQREGRHECRNERLSDGTTKKKLQSYSVREPGQTWHWFWLPSPKSPLPNPFPLASVEAKKNPTHQRPCTSKDKRLEPRLQWGTEDCNNVNGKCPMPATMSSRNKKHIMWDNSICCLSLGWLRLRVFTFPTISLCIYRLSLQQAVHC